MKQDWHPDKLAQSWTLSADERDWLGNRTSGARLAFAVLLKSFQLEGRFPDTLKEVAAGVVTHLARQVGVPPDSVLNDGEWSERTQRSQHVQVREHCGFRAFHAADEPAFVKMVSGLTIDLFERSPPR